MKCNENQTGAKYLGAHVWAMANSWQLADTHIPMLTSFSNKEEIGQLLAASLSFSCHVGYYIDGCLTFNWSKTTSNAGFIIPISH